jgi:ubiquinone/menaquinone biosynthesis C-methylase UbiE
MQKENMSYFDELASTYDDLPGLVDLMRDIGKSILTEASPAKEWDILDYGCGTGLLSLYLLPHVQSVTGADSSEQMLNELQKKIDSNKIESIKTVKLDLINDPIPEERYHAIVISMALHHVANTEKLISQFHQMLHPQGVLCIADLDTEPGTFHSEASPAFHNGFDRKDLINQVNNIGFCNTKATLAANLNKQDSDDVKRVYPIFLITCRKV